MSEAREDRDLVATYLANHDEGAFGELYHRHTPRLFGLALRLTGNRRAEAEDVVQEAWVRAAERFSAFRWESSLPTWLSGIAVRVWSEFLKARRRETSGESGEEPIDFASLPADRLDLEHAVSELPAGFRSVLLLHDVEGFTHVEISQMLGIDSGTSKSQLARARQALRRRLGSPDIQGGKHERVG